MFEDFSDLVTVAKVDATANDVPDEIQGFPTIKLYTAKDKKNPVEYSGPRTVEDLSKFITENGSNKVDPHSERDDAEEVETEGMPQQAPAATDKVKEGIKGKVTSVIKEAAEAVGTALLDSDETQDEHDEL